AKTSNKLIRIGEFHIDYVGPARYIDLEGIRQVSGWDVYGLLGMDFLRKHVVQFDFDRGKVSFLKSAPTSERFPLGITFGEGGVPSIDVRIAFLGSRKFVVDTGKFGVASGDLSSGDFRRLASIGSLKPLGEWPAIDLVGYRQRAYRQPGRN